MTASPQEVRAAAARAARTSYGRLVAVLAAAGGDLQLAEDALSAAFEKALLHWPETGVPANPEGWLMTVARNGQRDLWRSAAHRRTTPLAPEVLGDGADRADAPAPGGADGIPDRRLALLFVCAHPAIDEAIRTPLMLQSVLGFDAAEIARAFAVPASAMAQRLVRAKRRIRDTRIPFAVPSREVLPGRLVPVLEAVYGCFAIARGSAEGGEMVDEAQYLAVTLASLLESEPEAWALAALITLARAREPAQRAAEYVPLEEQDVSCWDASLIAEGEEYLRRAGAGQAGRFQLEAAVQAVHCARAATGRTDWSALRTLYGALCVLAPTLGARVALATAVGHVDGPLGALRILDEMGEAGAAFQPAWAARAHFLAAAGRAEQARDAYDRARVLATDPAVRAFLARRAARLTG